MFQNKTTKKNRLGSTAQKVLLLLAGGVALSLTHRPDHYFRIIQLVAKEWQNINRRNLHKAIRKLYQSKLIDFKENSDNTCTLVLTDNGKKRVLRYNLENLKIKKPAKWDGLWRVVIFDVPEYKKEARDTLSLKLKKIGMLPIQKSVFISPYECKDEIDFILEVFDVRPYVRFLLVKEIDIALDLKQKFQLS